MSEKNRQGFTLIEILISLGIIVILGGAVLAMQYIITQNRIVVNRNIASVEEANYNVTTIVREIRNSRPSEGGTYPIESASDDEFIFYSDADFDEQVERLRYTLNSNTLERGIIKPVGTPATYPSANEIVKTLSTNVRNLANPAFVYYNGDWPADTVNNPLATPIALSDIKLVKVSLRFNTQDSTPERDYLIESFAQIRTLKENL